MKRKKKTKKKATASPILSSDDKIQLESLLKDYKNIDSASISEHISSPTVAQAFVENLPANDENIIPFLLSLQKNFKQKKVQKALKKAVFKLKRLGIPVPDFEPDEIPGHIGKSAETGSPLAYLSALDGIGNRAVFIALPLFPKGFDVGMGVINDESGVIQFNSGTCSKKRLKELQTNFTEQVGIMVETSLSHAATVLEKAYEQSKKGSGQMLQDYLSLRTLLLEKADLLENPVIYDLQPGIEISTDAITESQLEKLFNHLLFQTWIIDYEKIKPLLKEIENAKESPLLLSEMQKAEHIRGLKQKWIEENYEDSKRIILKNRLEEMSFIFFKMGEDKFGQLTLNIAGSIEVKEQILHLNPFLDFYLNRSLDLYSEVTPDEEGEISGKSEDASIIIP